MPYFSIIIPVYNVAPYLRKCLDSVLAQTFTDWEAICVDDGSTDESGAILDGYSARDNRFMVFHQSNQGVSVARQVALNNAKGKWVVSVDSDDWIELNHLRNLYKETLDFNLDMIWFDYYYDKNGNSILCTTNGEDNSNIHLEMLLKGELMGSLCNHLLSMDFIQRHDIKFPPQGCNMAEDLFFLCDFLSYKPRIKWVDNAMYHYVYRYMSACNQQDKSFMVFSFLKTIEILLLKIQDRVDSKLLQYRKTLLKFHLYDKEYIETKRYLSVFPEIRDAWCLEISLFRKIVFWLSIRGWRSLIIKVLMFVRWIKNNKKLNRGNCHAQNFNSSSCL